MPLPTAVKRNAELAKSQIAARQGNPQGAPQSNQGDFLNITSTNPSTSSAQHLAPMATDTQAAPTAENAVHLTQAGQETAHDTHRPHALAAGFDGQTQGDTKTQHDGAPNATLSANADSANANEQGSSQGNAQPDFIDPENWKARYAALRASRDSRIGDLERQVAEGKTRIQELEQAVPQVQDAAPNFTIDDDTRERLGPEQAKVFDQFNDSIEQRFQAQDDEKKAQARHNMSRFETNLTSMVPKWRDINVQPGFLAWLGENDPVIGQRRQDMLDQFVNELDAGSAAALFRSYALNGGHTQQPNSHAHTLDFATDRSETGLGSEEKLVEIWSQSEIADFYQQKSRLYQSGKLKGEKLAQVQAEEARIRIAMDEGRVDMNS